jgi:hypothetical protein
MKQVTSYYNKLGHVRESANADRSRIQAWLLISLIIRAWRCLRVSGMIQIIAHHIHTVVQNDIIILHSYKIWQINFIQEFINISAAPIKCATTTVQLQLVVAATSHQTFYWALNFWNELRETFRRNYALIWQYKHSATMHNCMNMLARKYLACSILQLRKLCLQEPGTWSGLQSRATRYYLPKILGLIIEARASQQTLQC